MLIDTNIIIYLTDMIQPYEPLSRLIFNMIEMGDASAVLSIVSVTEVMQGPIKKGHHQNAQDVKNYLLNFGLYLGRSQIALFLVSNELQEQVAKDLEIPFVR